MKAGREDAELVGVEVGTGRIQHRDSHGRDRADPAGLMAASPACRQTTPER